MCNNDLNNIQPIVDPACTSSVTSVTEQLLKSHEVCPETICPGPVVLKTPVVLAETSILIPIRSHITLQEAALEIKRIKKNVYLTQCHIVPHVMCGWGMEKKGILYIEGFVRKNIEYATATCTPANGTVSGTINHTTANVDFSFTTEVEFARPPIFKANETTRELELFEDNLATCDKCAENVIGREPCEQDFFHNEKFNEKVFCELVEADLLESDIHRNPTSLTPSSPCVNPQEQIFSELTEKMVLKLTLKILQKQQVAVMAIPFADPIKK